MPVAFRSAGARLRKEVLTGSEQVALPAGHAAGDLLMLVVITDDNTGVTATPAGWTTLLRAFGGTSRESPYYGGPHVFVFSRISPGTGSTVPVSFSTAAWPSGSPYVLAWTVAYTGVDPAAPIGQFGLSGIPGLRPPEHAHPVVSTTRTGSWLVSLRAIGAPTQATFTDSVAGDAERVDEWGGMNQAPSAAWFDSAGAVLPVGAQTQRTTTASRTAAYGSVAISFVIQPPDQVPSATAQAQTAAVSALALGAAPQTSEHGWDICGADGLPDYRFTIGWGDGAGDDVTGSIISEIATRYGRDQARQFAPATVGTAAFTLDNSTRRYSPENDASPLYGTLDPARTMTADVTFNGAVHALFTGRIDDFDVKTEFGERSASFSFLDGLASLQGVRLSTPVLAARRTGELLHTILDGAGWTGPRRIDPGATVVRYWWEEGTDALTAVNNLVRSEGPPAVAYVAPDGAFVFHDRHHRMLSQESLTAQAVFHAGRLGDCTPDGVPEGALSLARPFTYAHGWRDIVNTVNFDVGVRWPSATLEQVWSDETSYLLEAGQSVQILATSSDPFVEAQPPVPGTDFTVTSPAPGATVTVLLDRDSGASARLTLTAVGGPVTVTGLQLRARSLAVRRTVRVAMTDPGSIGQFGEKAYPEEVPWASVEDAQAIAGRVLLHYAQRRPTVQIRVVSSDPAHFVQVLRRTVGDRVRIVNAEMGLDADFFVESVDHTVQRLSRPGRPPVHSVVLGCEKDLVGNSNPFTFDKRGAGFDQGVFGLVEQEDPATVFVFDHPEQGRFDTGRFGT
jgi:hypothetical protein